jgi:O-antigen ligase
LFGLSGAALIIVLIIAVKRLPVLYTRIFVILMFVVTVVSATYVINGLPTPPVSLNQPPELPLPDWHRQVIWGFTIEVIKSTPFFGVGPNTINLSPGAKELIPGLNQEYIPSHPHNWLLEIAAETGLIGLTVFLFAFLLATQLLITRAIGNNAEALAATALSATFWISSLANFSIWATWWLTIFSVLVSFPLAAMIAEHRCKEVSKDFTSF